MQYIPDFEKDAAAKLELEALSPALFDIQNQAQMELPIAEDMPDNYFDNLFDDVWGKLQSETHIQTFVPAMETTETVAEPTVAAPQHIVANRSRLWSVAASIALLVTAAVGLTWNGLQTQEPKVMAQADFNKMLDKISVEEIASYLMDNSEELDLRLLAVSDNAYEAFNQQLVNDLHTDETFHWDY